STFADQFPIGTNNQGPLGIAFTPGGGVLVADNPGNVRLFATDTDGQHAPNAPVRQNYGSENAVGLAMSSGHIYMTEIHQGNGSVVELNSDGTLRQTIVSNLVSAVGISANPTNGHLFVSDPLQGSRVYDIDPVAQTATSITGAGGGFYDGLA